MAHNLAQNIKEGGYAFVSGNKQSAWHGLGTVLDGQLSAEDCLKYGGLDYQVQTTPMHIEVGGQKIVVPNRYATFRTDNNTPLGVVGDRYQVIQNKDAFVFFDSITGGGEAIYETAGSLGNGEKIFITAKMPDYVTINGTDDVTEFYVVLTSTHDGTGAIKALITPIRVVCQNTLGFALQNNINCVSIRHTKSAEENLKMAHKVLGITNEYAKQMDELLNKFNTIKVSDKQAQEVINQLFPAKNEEEVHGKTANLRNELMDAYMTGTGQSKIIGTGYGLLQGVTYYTSHLKGYKDQDVKFREVLEGQSTKLVERAKDLILAL